ISTEMNHVESIIIPPAKAGNFRPMPSGYMICTATYGNGAQTIGSMITVCHPEMEVIIKCSITHTESLVVDHGMSHRNSVAVRRACAYTNSMRMSLWGFA